MKPAARTPLGALYRRDTSEKVITLIKRHRPELAKFGVKSLALFGSVARGEAGPDSDVDILLEFEGRATFDGYMNTKYYKDRALSGTVFMERSDE